MAFDYAYGRTALGELELHGVHLEESGKFQLTGVTIEGQLVIPSRGFVKSLCHRFAISRHEQTKRNSGELLSLIVRSFPLAEVDYRIEWDETGTTWLFARETSLNKSEHTFPGSTAKVPSSESRLKAYGFGIDSSSTSSPGSKPSSDMTASESSSSSSANKGQAANPNPLPTTNQAQEAVSPEDDWPLLRAQACDAVGPRLPGNIESPPTDKLFLDSPQRTPRSSRN